jgi:hypothetical protein
MATRRITARYPGRCRACGRETPGEAKVWWDTDTKSLRCDDCGPGGAIPPVIGRPGASARRESERRHAAHEQRVRAAHPRIGGAVLALTKEPQHVVAWEQGAAGELVVGAMLEEIAGPDVTVMHDRRMGRGSANIDHLVIAPSGVWVIDAKRYRGKVERRDVGGFFRDDVRLFVGGRDRTKLAHEVLWQVDAVRELLGADARQTRVRPALCFVSAEWSLLAQPFDIGGVTVAHPKALMPLITGEATIAAAQLERVRRRLANGMRAA